MLTRRLAQIVRPSELKWCMRLVETICDLYTGEEGIQFPDVHRRRRNAYCGSSYSVLYNEYA